MSTRRRLGGLAVYDHEGPPGGPRVVLVHGAMDRAATFLRTTRHLTDHEVVRYDRRGYGRSADSGIADDLDAQVDDLITVLDGRPAAVVGHSLGGVIALVAAVRCPDLVSAAAGFESPTPWFDWWPRRSAGGAALGIREEGAEAVAERFMRELIGHERWDSLPSATRSQRRAEGPALIADLVAVRGAAAYEPEALSALGIPIVLGHGTRSRPHHMRAAEEIHDRISGSELVVIEGASHDAHASHPDDFAAFVRCATAR